MVPASRSLKKKAAPAAFELPDPSTYEQIIKDAEEALKNMPLIDRKELQKAIAEIIKDREGNVRDIYNVE